MSEKELKSAILNAMLGYGFKSVTSQMVDDMYDHLRSAGLLDGELYPCALCGGLFVLADFKEWVQAKGCAAEPVKCRYCVEQEDEATIRESRITELEIALAAVRSGMALAQADNVRLQKQVEAVRDEARAMRKKWTAFQRDAFINKLADTGGE